MSDQEGNAPEAGSQPAQTSIPKERLDEVIQRNRELQNHLQFTQQQLTHMVQQQRTQFRGEPKPDPEMERLKQDNPGMYRTVMAQKRELKEARAGLFSVMDKQDRQDFIMEHGVDAKKKLPEIEGIIERERQNGNFNATRAGIYLWMLGQERLRTPQTPKTQQVAPQAQDGPSDDPGQATSVRPGTTSADRSKTTFEERRKALENEVF